MYDPWTWTIGGNVGGGGRGCAGWSGVKGGKWDNCNSIINKIYFLKRNIQKSKWGNDGCLKVYLIIWTSRNWDSLRYKQMFKIIIKINSFYFKKYILLIMLLQLSHFPPFTPLHPAHPLPPTFPTYSSCPWVIHINSLASTFPMLFLPSPCLLSTYHYGTYSLYLFPLSPPPTLLLITLHVISISVIVFLF